MTLARLMDWLQDVQADLQRHHADLYQLMMPDLTKLSPEVIVGVVRDPHHGETFIRVGDKRMRREPLPFTVNANGDFFDVGGGGHVDIELEPPWYSEISVEWTMTPSTTAAERLHHGWESSRARKRVREWATTGIIVLDEPFCGVTSVGWDAIYGGLGY